MTDTADQEQPAGWEHIWSSGDIPPRYRSIAEPNASVVEWAGTLAAGARVLDVGCGAGRHIVYLGMNGFQVAGIDVAPTGVELARAACAARGIPFDGRVADMTTLPWDDSTFDAALSISTIHHQTRAGIAQTLAEIGRVLKPGSLLLADFPCTHTLTYQDLRRQVAAGQIAEIEPNTFVDDRRLTEDDDGFLPHHFCDEADLRDLLRSFDVIRLWPDLHDATLENGDSGKIGKWVAWARRSVTLSSTSEQ